MTDQFIQKAKEVHGDTYDYSKTVYENNLKEVIIICKIHGEFLQLPKTHKRGNGCITCGREKTSKARKSNVDAFIQKANEVHDNKYDYSKVQYNKASEKVIIICIEHGEFLQTPNGHLGGAGCRKCSTQINSDKARKTIEEFIKESIEVHGEIYDYSKVEYKKTGEDVIIICREHGEFLQTPNSHLSGSGCKFCSGCYKSNTQEFIIKSIKIHGDKYDYSKVEYNTAIEKVLIICRQHGEFSQSPNCHLGGAGCSKCGYKMTIFSTEEFIIKANELHGEIYDYSKVDYNKMAEKVIIICREHGEFEQTPSNHITHCQGCQKCAGNYLSNTEEFIIKAMEFHGKKYNYSKVRYINNHTYVTIICEEHGEFEQAPANHLGGNGCKFCGIEQMKIKQRTCQEDFIVKANEVHKNKYDYSKVEYNTAREKITIICKEHGEFEQVPDSHLRGSGCKICTGCYLSNTEEFIEKAIKVHGEKFDYSKVDYKKSNEKVTIICKKHGEIEQTPGNHLYGFGCVRCCNSKGYSLISIQYLNTISILNKIYIEHAENGGEFSIPETRFKADGYCKETNTIYEFHGDLWHGNPKIFKPDDISFFGTTYGELYQKTLEKEKKIKELGFNLVVMWEADWKRIINSINILKNKFKNVKLIK
jgi:hypothetical protein